MMKHFFSILSIALLLVSCKESTKVFEGKLVSKVSVLYNDTTSAETRLEYDIENRLLKYEEVKNEKAKQNIFAIDSIKYMGDTIVMYDRNNSRRFIYILKDGYALNCYMTSDSEGSASATFKYLNGYLCEINVLKSLSFSNKPDTVFTLDLDLKNKVTAYKDEFDSQYKISVSEQKNEHSLLLPPFHYGDYTPGYYAGILGKTSNHLIDSFDQNGILNAKYQYTISDKETVIELNTSNAEKVVYRYSFK